MTSKERTKCGNAAATHGASPLRRPIWRSPAPRATRRYRSVRSANSCGPVVAGLVKAGAAIRARSPSRPAGRLPGARAEKRRVSREVDGTLGVGSGCCRTSPFGGGGPGHGGGRGAGRQGRRRGGKREG